MSLTRSRIAASVCCLGSFFISTAGTVVAAEDELKREVSAIAKQVKLLLDQTGKDAIAVGDFRGRARLSTSAGPSIAKALTDSLKGLGVLIKRKAEFEINGEFEDAVGKITVQDPATGNTKVEDRIKVSIKAQVIDKRGDVVTVFEPRGVFDLASVVILTGATVAVPSKGSDLERSREVEKAIDRSDVHLDRASTRISAKAVSPYAIEVLVKNGRDYLPRAASKVSEGGEDSDKFAFVRIARNEVYAVRLLNDSPYDAAVTLTIDGLNDFAFSENKEYSHWIVPAKRSLDVMGWHVTNQSSDSFLVTEYAKSAAHDALPNSSSVGTITASFAAAWPPKSEPPADEQTRKGEPGNATAKGPPVKTGYEEVRWQVGRFREAVSVRYNRDFVPSDLPVSSSMR